LKTSSSNKTRFETKLNAWLELLDRTNKSPNSKTGNTIQNSFNKFESTIEGMVKNAPGFPEKIKAAPSELHAVLLDFQNVIKKVVPRLADNMKGVVEKLADNTKAVNEVCSDRSRSVILFTRRANTSVLYYVISGSTSKCEKTRSKESEITNNRYSITR